MDTAVKKKYEEWLNAPSISEKDKEELKAIANDEKEITERFYKDLDFGTGGLRGIRGIGTNRINVYMIRKATQGLANYMLKSAPDAKERGIVIAYDSRIMSTEFALNTALVMAANGIKAYLFESLRPTPELSFAVRELKTLAGVVVTASHNPPEYNGYKVYWDDGAQVVAPHDKLIIDEVNKVTDLSQIKFVDEADAKASGLLKIIGKEIDDRFIEEILKHSIKPEIAKEYGDKFKIVFTPLHGTGNVPVRRVLTEMGFKNVYIVAEQELPDGNFPTVGYPNPEEPKVFKMGEELADKVGAKIVMATDPDADRIGIAVKDSSGKWTYPNGNQVGLLFCEYILANLKNKPDNAVVISTVVSTPMLEAIAASHGASVMRTLTGFKYIGEKIKEFEQGKYNKTFVLGFEESYGYLRGTHARDKDSVVAAMLVAEMAAYYESIGSSVELELDKIYKKYGYGVEGIKTLTIPGKEGAERIVAIMSNLRTNMPAEIAGQKVVVVKDFLNRIEKDMKTGVTKDIDLPVSDVLQIVLADNTVINARPSGTEPKIKFYFAVQGETKAKADEKLKYVTDEFSKIADK